MKPDEYLPNLSEEATKISDLLHGLVFSDVIYYMKDEIFTADRLIANFSKYGDKFDIFYFSGHAKDGALKFSDNFISNTDRMADVININLRNLQLGFFNACETFDLAKKIVQKRASGKSNNKLVMITCGCAINAFLAERFATLFFNHVGRPGTYYDAYKNASTLLSLVNDKLRFREFYSMEDLESASEDFDYAFIDIPLVARPETPPSFAPSRGEPVPAGSAPIPSGPVVAPAGNPVGASVADAYMEAAYSDPSKPVPAGDPIHDMDLIRAVPTSSRSIINADKKTLDILSANYVKECTQTAMTSNALDPRQMEILNQAIKGTQEIVDGNVVTGKVKQLWKEAARILPGVDSKNDFRSLIKVSKGAYNNALDMFFGNADKKPTVANIKQTVDAGD
ncbi:hypothetical protein ACX0G7_26965 [Flavitalea antarctica]